MASDSIYRFFLLDNGLGDPYEIYRSPPFRLMYEAKMERAKKDGSWSGLDQDTRKLSILWMSGDFEPGGDEISEEEAERLLAKWRDGAWPGRP